MEKVGPSDQLIEYQKSVEDLTATLSRKAKEIEIIQVIASDIISTLDLDTILQNILSSMKRVLGFEHSMILMLEDSGELLRVVASQGFEASGVSATVTVGQGIIGTVARHKRMMRMNNIGYQRSYLTAVKSSLQEKKKLETEDAEVPLPGLSNVESQIAIPLMVQERITGVLSVESPVLNDFDELDETLLTILGNQAAAAIDNARLYTVAAERLDDLNHVNGELAQLNESLEEKVEARTAELSETLDELTATQNQLIVREKLASLGHLVAGIAHEINTPVGVVNSAGDVVQRCIARIDAELAKEQGTNQTDTVQKPLTVLRDSVGSMRSAGERIATLVQSLKTFAQLDAAQIKMADLNEGLQSTITLLRADLPREINIEEEYGEIPEIVCSLGEVNQVFMSLLLNAVEAIDGQGTIRVRTAPQDEWVQVHIVDTGRGISPEQLKTLFEFSFSRDRERVKMGAGLATSYGIVQRHGGNIEVESTPGEGSEFTVKLPVRSPLKETG